MLPPRPAQRSPSTSSLRGRTRGAASKAASKATPPRRTSSTGRKEVFAERVGSEELIQPSTEVAELKDPELDQLHAEIARWRAENANLKDVLETKQSSRALLEEVAQDCSPFDHQVLCLKEELCNMLERRRRLQHAVHARHQGLQRAMSLGTDGHLHQALADGAAVAEAESLEPSSEARSRSLSSRRPPGPPTEPRRSWATSEILDLEQLIFDTAIALDAASSQWAELASRLQRVSRDLLQHARELPESKISTKALPRKLRRHEVFHLAQGRLPEMEKDELGGMPRAPVKLPPAVLKALADTLEAAAGERAATKQEVEQIVANSLDLLADWATTLWTARASATEKPHKR